MHDTSIRRLVNQQRQINDWVFKFSRSNISPCQKATLLTQIPLCNLSFISEKIKRILGHCRIFVLDASVARFSQLHLCPLSWKEISLPLSNLKTGLLLIPEIFFFFRKENWNSVVVVTYHHRTFPCKTSVAWPEDILYKLFKRIVHAVC